MKGFDQITPATIIQRAANGDLGAMETIYANYIDASYNLAYRITMNSALAEDACQEAFLKVITNITKFKFEGSFSGWVRRIVVNESIGKTRHERQTDSLEDNVIDIVDESNLFKQDWITHVMDLEYYLRQLPASHRAVLILHEMEGYKHKEIAELLGKSESFSKMALLRAYKLLKRLTTQQEPEYAPD